MAAKVPLSYTGNQGVSAPVSGGKGDDLAKVLRQVADDLAAVKAAHEALVTKYNAVLAKLDADAGVTDTNYAATQAAATVVTIGLTKAS